MTSYLNARWYADGIEVAPGSDGRLRPAAPSESTPSAWWAPGMIDLQVNGFGGVDYSGTLITAMDVDRVIDALAATGTTRHLPTIISAPRERITANLATLSTIVEAAPHRRLAIPGFHVEGPFISPEDGPRGAHDARFVRDPDRAEVAEWIDAAGGRLRIVTLAPERPGAIEMIEFLGSFGIIAAIGHTAASPEEITRAVDAGARLSTHLGNGSHAVLPRLKNYLWTQMADDRLQTGIITDGFHLPPDALRSIIRAKEPSRIVLVSDAAPTAGTSPGRTRWGDTEVEVHADGHVSLAGTPFLAGAGHLLNHNVPHAIVVGGMTLAQAVAACSDRAAALCTPENYRRGSGTPADGVGAPGDYLDRIRFTWHIESAPMQMTHVVRAGDVVFERPSDEVPDGARSFSGRKKR